MTAKAPQILNGLDALNAPCQSCTSHACCWFVPLETVSVNRYDDFDRLIYASGFEKLEVGAHSDGHYTIYLAAPCRHLTPTQDGCSIYGTKLMPQVCKSVIARGCWYRANVTNDRGTMVRLNESELRELGEYYRFNTDRLVSETPSWRDILGVAKRSERKAELAQIPEAKQTPAEKFPWEKVFDGDAPPEDEPLSWSEALQNPCSGCEAFCCTHFEVKVGTPKTWSDFDRIRYLLQFPSMELMIRDEGPWIISLKSRCSHLSGQNTCNLFDKPERPRFCVDYNAHSCGFRRKFADPYRFRIRYEDFIEVAMLFEFSLDGKLRRMPSVTEACERVLAIRAQKKQERETVVEG